MNHFDQMQSNAPSMLPPRVTVVVIVRDGERFIEEALASICAQTMAAWEVVVVDDGSYDGTRDLVARFIDDDPSRFSLFRHERGACQGMSASRNLGIANARGEFITFLDHDDVMLPDKLERQCALLDQHASASTVMGPNLRWHSWSQGGAVLESGASLSLIHI